MKAVGLEGCFAANSEFRIKNSELACGRTGGSWACTIGCFDGLHLGHAVLLGQLGKWAEEQGLSRLVVTMDPYPGELFGRGGERLEEREDKLERLAGMADEVVELRFDRRVAALSAEEFMERVLRRLGVKALLMGYDHSFGRPQGETDDDYTRMGRRWGIDVRRGEPLLSGGEPVSSTRIRRLLGEGRVEDAAGLLGRDYCLVGRVVHGAGRGRGMGFPTLNVVPRDGRLMWPREGAYAVRVRLGGRVWNGMAGVGERPTFGGEQGRTIEVNLFGFEGDAYGEPVGVEFVGWLREERRFADADSLRRQLEKDREGASRMLVRREE